MVRYSSAAAAALVALAANNGCDAAKPVKVVDPGNIFCGNASCYEVLGVQRNASREEIKRSYRAVSLLAHPDKNLGDNGESKAKFEVRDHPSSSAQRLA
jgi:DnaJ-domain-containing protein 1